MKILVYIWLNLTVSVSLSEDFEVFTSYIFFYANHFRIENFYHGSSILHSIPGENSTAGNVLGVEQAAQEYFLLEDDRSGIVYRPQRVLCTKFIVDE